MVDSKAPVNRVAPAQPWSGRAVQILDTQGAAVSKNAATQDLTSPNPVSVAPASPQSTGIDAPTLALALSAGRFEESGWRACADGSRLWADLRIDPLFDSAGVHVGFVRVVDDTTDRRNAEDALRHSEERFRLFVQNVSDYAIYFLDPQGYVTSWNAGAERLKGYAAEEIIGRHFSQFYVEEDRGAGIPQAALGVAIRTGRFKAEGWRARKDGSRFWANVVIDPIYDDRRNLIGFTKITRDITETRDNAIALAVAQQKVFQAEKFEALAQLTGGVAHDFNNILAAIIGSLNLVRRRLDQGEDISRFLDNAMQAADRGATLTRRLLAYARKQELKLEPVDIRQAVEEMAELLESSISGDIRIETHFGADLPPVVADRAQLELAILNLVVNARDAMEGGGRIVLSAIEAQGDARLDGARTVRFTVSDDGQGMGPDVLAQATDPFFTTKGIGKGSGLGLPMVKGMVEQSGGALRIASTPGQGACIEILLLAAESPAAGATDQADRRQQSTLPKLRILAVDDDPIVLLNTATALADAGHEVLQALCARTALAQLSAQPVDVVVVDYAMPGMDGAQLAAETQRRFPGVNVIVVTGADELPDGLAPPAARLARPFTEAELAARIAAFYAS